MSSMFSMGWWRNRVRSSGLGLAILTLSLSSIGCASSGMNSGSGISDGSAIGAKGISQAPGEEGTVERTLAHIPGVDVITDSDVPSLPEGVTAQSVSIKGSDLRRGRATTIVAAPISKVRKSVLGFKSYPEFMPHYKSARLLGTTPSGGRDVYMEITALHGAMTMWTRIELEKRIEDGVEIHESKFVDGNIKDFKAIWRLKKLGPNETELSLEVALEPDFPLPSSLINDENLKGSVKGVTAMRNRAEGRPAATE